MKIVLIYDETFVSNIVVENRYEDISSFLDLNYPIW